MGENTKIEWATHTFNPWVGCAKVSPGCDHCYAEGWAKRSGSVQWGPHAERRRTTVENWRQPLKWNREAEASGTRPRVFCASLADVFDNAVPAAWRADLFAMIRATPHLDWLLVTKRIGNVPAMLPADWGNGYPNVWLLITVTDQAEADRDIPKLLSVPAAVRGLSAEPLLGPVDLTEIQVPSEHDKLNHSGFYPSRFNALTTEYDDKHYHQPPAAIDWVIVGGESGPKARPMHPQWARDLRDQCAGVPFLFKQHGEWSPAPQGGTAATLVHDFADGERVFRVGKSAAGRLLDGVQHDGYPEVLP